MKVNFKFYFFVFLYLFLGNCSDFKTRMMGDPDFARDVDVFGARQISDITAKKVIFDSGGNPEQYNCDANPIKTVQVSYVRGSCIAYMEW